MGYTPFKMKGSPAKLGTIQGTEGHRSAVQKASPAKWVPLAAGILGRIGLGTMGRAAAGRAATGIGSRALTLMPKNLPVKGVNWTKYNPFGKTGGKTIDLTKGPGGVFGFGAPKSTGWGSKMMNFGKGMFTWPATIAGIGTGLWGYSSGAKGERERLKNIGESLTSKNGKPIMENFTKTKGKKSYSSGDPYARAKKNDPNLPAYIRERKKHAKGSAEYNAIQNRINAAYGVSKRHGGGSASASASASASSGMGAKKDAFSGGEVKYKKRLFGGQTKVTRSNGNVKKEKYTRKGKLKKTVTKIDGKRTVTKGKDVKFTDKDTLPTT